MKFLDKVLDYAERLPEGIERARDQIIGVSNMVVRCHRPLIISTLYQAFWTLIVSAG